MTRVGLVACGSSKLNAAAPARDLYTSQLFRKSAAFAESTCDRWYILSAKHGLVHPDTVHKPYDVKLGIKTSEPIHAWAQRVRDQLAAELADVPRVVLVVLAGEQYQTVVRPCQWPFQIPMKGLGIGQQLAFLTTAPATGEAAPAGGVTFRCRQCGKPIFDKAAAIRHMERLEGHTVDPIPDTHTVPTGPVQANAGTGSQTVQAGTPGAKNRADGSE